MIHLHVHSNFSFLDGASPPDRLLRRAAELEMPALALTDHNGLYGAVRFMHAAKGYGVRGIVGCEVVVSCQLLVVGSQPSVVSHQSLVVSRWSGVDGDGGRGGRTQVALTESRLTTQGSPLATEGRGYKAHLTLLARDRRGYANLCRIVTMAQLGHQDDPWIDVEDLAHLTEGVIALSGCRRGEIPRLLLAGRREEAIEVAARYAEMFRDGFWIELEHHLLPDDTYLVDELIEVADEVGVGCVIANDVHYAYPEEYRLRDVMACIQTRTTLEEWTDVRHANGEYYLKSREELRGAFELPDDLFDRYVANTEIIAEGCEVQLLAVSTRPPEYADLPVGETAFSYLYRLCQEGVRERYRPLTPAVSTQLAHELSVIEEMGLASFFLCVWDIVRFSREKGIRCAGRGSAADSIVAYVLGITTVDPLANNLLFERFLNPGRVGMPDVDIDFDSRRRDEVIAYIEKRYTAEHAAMVANVITYRSRSAIRDVAKAMGFSPVLIEFLATKLSYRGVGHMREELMESCQLSAVSSQLLGVGEAGENEVDGEGNGADERRSPLRIAAEGESSRRDAGRLHAQRAPTLTKGDEDGGLIAHSSWLATQSPLELLLELCEQLDGYPRHLSLHNGGMLITAEPLIDVVPLEYATSGVRVCQFNKDDVELLGLIKFDILGLRTLSILDEAVHLIKENRGIELPIDDLALDDPAVYDLICSSKTIGIFQVESPGQWQLLARSQPRTFGDIIIEISLFRPGPLQGGMVNPYVERRNGREPVTYPHPSLENCLKDTLGVVIFQEQVLQVAHDFAGLSYADADGLRRAMSHYRTETQMDACRQEFVESAVRLGRDRGLAEKIYEMIAYFSGYGFCRSHAAAFAKTVYQTAFLKVYYPAEFLAAILSNEPCCYYPTQTVIEEARRWGIRVLPVDINRSITRYTVENGDRIRMGFMQVKGLTEDSAEGIVVARGRRAFQSLADFWGRTRLDRDAVENLIAVGAFDTLGINRRKLLWSLEEVCQTVLRGGVQKPMFQRRELSMPLPELPALTELDIAGLDMTLQGASARYSVMSFYRRSLQRARVLSIGQVEGRAPGTLVRTAGIVISRQRPPTAKGMTFLVLADEEGELPVAMYPQVYAEHRLVVNGTSSLVVEGTIQRERTVTSLLATRVWRLTEVGRLEERPAGGKVLVVGC